MITKPLKNQTEKLLAFGLTLKEVSHLTGLHKNIVKMMEALKKMPLDELDVLIVENVGNLVCPAEFDIGATLATMLLSIPEGDDKCIKYPLMFTVTKAVIVTKMDVKDFFDFNLEALEKNTRRLNNDLRIFPVSVKTGDGMKTVMEWLNNQITSNL